MMLSIFSRNDIFSARAKSSPARAELMLSLGHARPRQPREFRNPSRRMRVVVAPPERRLLVGKLTKVRALVSFPTRTREPATDPTQRARGCSRHVGDPLATTTSPHVPS
ncbi:hypothetical protein BN12_2400008 [Nostocoides japonicum T1-X7]|uniref:Uncharacterized protein n=1 Tax=Nostocoides japonicum T1-X7 TaxID=1194083 RepID=A0A077M1A7_9MICO|nr:hypothetical protein BN12_2400008 [Tetrasphaera japonica T1-X7]